MSPDEISLSDNLDIATAQPFLQNHLRTLKAQALLHGKALTSSFISGNGNKLDPARKSFNISEKLGLSLGARELQKGTLLIRAVATFESKRLVQKEDGQRGHNNSHVDMDSVSRTNWHQPASEDAPELEEREKLRRMRISKANKGNTPWNKGRKHSAETLQRIKERTRLAMQDPKVKMKLVNLGHAQSNETRKKIAVGVRMGWKRRQEKLLVQESCYFEWQNLIAEASRNGYIGEEELQWNSYEILEDQLEQEWLESVEKRKTRPRPIGCKRAPKSLEQRRKIAQSIAAKWADPEYRNRVCNGLAKFHGAPAGVERRPRRRPSGDTKSTRWSSTKKQTSDSDNSSTMTSQIQWSRMRRSNAPKYKDPQAKSKLEMIKNIRAQRASSETKTTEAIDRARLLIAKAEEAAKTLEAAALKSPIAQASLIETRKLIAEAIQSIASIETAQLTSKANGRYPSVPSTESMNLGANQAIQKKLNGHQIVASPSNEADFGFDKSTMQKILIGED